MITSLYYFGDADAKERHSIQSTDFHYEKQRKKSNKRKTKRGREEKAINTGTIQHKTRKSRLNAQIERPLIVERKTLPRFHRSSKTGCSLHSN